MSREIAKLGCVLIWPSGRAGDYHMKIGMPRKRRNVWPFLGFGALTAVISQFFHGEYPVDARSIGNLIGGILGGALMGWFVYLIAERFYPKK